MKNVRYTIFQPCFQTFSDFCGILWNMIHGAECNALFLVAESINKLSQILK